MRLNLHTDYSLRVLMFVGLKGHELSTISEICGGIGISRNNVMKVVYELGRHGYLETIRGKNGGVRLAAKPADISIGEVVRATENDLAIIGCLQSKDYCQLQKICVLRNALNEATSAFLAVLDGYTLEDLIRPRRPLAKLLGIASPNLQASELANS